MADWKRRGYVPDSEDEDDNDALTSAPHNELQQTSNSGVVPDVQILPSNNHANAQSEPKPQTYDVDSSSSTHTPTSAKLGTLLSQGLADVREVLATVPMDPAANLEDDSPLSSVASSPRMSLDHNSPPPTSEEIDQPLRSAGRTDSDYAQLLAAQAQRRTLRARAPIQLHPYLLEDVQYRELMRTRGIKPVQVPQQTALAGKSTAAEDTQNGESFRDWQAEETQDLQMLSDLSLSSSEEESQSPVRAVRQVADLDVAASDDELPALTQIIHDRTEPTANTRKPKRKALLRLPSSSKAISNSKSYDLAAGQYDLSTRSSQSQFDVPPSPPASSAAEDLDNGPAISRATSPTGLPTPLLSSEHGRLKRSRVIISAPEPSPLGSHDDRDTESSTSESELEEVQSTHRMTRKIRGVLPASWLKLDMQKQMISRDTKRHAGSSSNAIPDKGVARQMSASGKRGSDLEQQLILDLEDAESDSADSFQIVHLDVDRTMSIARNLDFGDGVIEDDTIDAMLPAASRRPCSSARRQYRQRKLGNNWSHTPTRERSSDGNHVSKSSRPQSADNSRRPNGFMRQKRVKKHHRSPQISIFDAPDLKNLQRHDQPQFLRLAARQVRASKGDGISSVAQKYFRLDNERDTMEMNKRFAESRATSEAFTRNHGLSPVARGDRSAAVTRLNATTSAPSKVLQQSEDQTTTTDALKQLKQSTDLLLKRTNINKAIAKFEEQVNDPSGSNHSPSPSTSKLRALFARENRSGAGQLLSSGSRQRQALIERESSRPPLSIPRRVPKKIQPARTALAPLPQPIKRAHSKSDRPLAAVALERSDPKIKVIRQPRKRTPRKRNIGSVGSDTAEMQEYDPPPTMVRHQSLSQPDLRRLWPSAFMMKTMFALDSRTQFRDNIIGSLVLHDAIVRHHCPSVYRTTRHQATSLLNTGSASARYRVGAYDDDSREIFDRFLAEIETLVPNHLAPVNNIEVAASGVQSIVAWIQDSIYFPATDDVSSPRGDTTLILDELEDTESITIKEQSSVHAGQMIHWSMTRPRDRFVWTSMTFIEKMIARAVPEEFVAGPGHSSRLLFLDWLMIWTFQLQAMVRGDELKEGLIETLCNKIMYVAMCSVVDVNGVNIWLDELRANHNPGRSSSTFFFGRLESAPVTILIVWHLGKELSRSQTSDHFYQIVSAAFAAYDWQGDRVKQAAAALLATAYIVPFLDLDCSGHVATYRQKDLPSQTNGWSYIVPYVNGLLAYFKDECGRKNDSYTRHWYLKSFLQFVYRLSFQYGWAPTPALVSLLLQIYSSNDMQPYWDTGDDASEFNVDTKTIFLNYGEGELIDYAQFLSIVRTVLAMQQNSMDDEEGSKPAVSASRLRALVYSLFPNNSKFYDAKEDLPTKHLLGLKNNFALYLVLYKNAPSGCRPRIAHLSNQVDLARSHDAVCTVAMNVWQCVTQCEIEENPAGSGMVREAALWLSSMLSQIILRYQNGAQDTQGLLEELFSNLREALTQCVSETGARQLLELMLSNIKGLLLDSGDQMTPRLSVRATKEVLAALREYIRATMSGSYSSDNLTLSIQRIIREVIQRMTDADHITKSELTSEVISTWFCIAQSLVRSLHKQWDDFLSPHSNLSLVFMSGSPESPQLLTSQQQFLTHIIESEQDAIFLEYRPLIFAYWVSGLLRPIPEISVTGDLTNQIAQHGSESLNLRSIFDSIRGSSQACNITSQDVADSRLILIQHLIENIHGQQGDPESEWLAGGLDENDMYMLLQTIASQMKKTWISLAEDPVAQNAYAPLIEAVINEIEIYPFEGYKLDPWFTDGTGFPRKSQTFDSIFKCRFGGDAGQLQKNSIVTFRLQTVQALKFSRQAIFAEDLERVFHCTDRLRVKETVEGALHYSIDLCKQAQFLRVVFATYLEQSGSREGARLVIPILHCLISITEKIEFRIDRLEPRHITEFVRATICCLSGVRTALESMGRYNSVTALLLKCAYTALDTVSALILQEGVDLEEEAYDTFVANAMALLEVAGVIIGEDMIANNAASFLERAQLPFELTLSEKERSLKKFAVDDLGSDLPRLGQLEIHETGYELEAIELQAREIVKLVGELFGGIVV